MRYKNQYHCWTTGNRCCFAFRNAVKTNWHSLKTLFSSVEPHSVLCRSAGNHSAPSWTTWMVTEDQTATGYHVSHQTFLTSRSLNSLCFSLFSSTGVGIATLSDIFSALFGPHNRTGNVKLQPRAIQLFSCSLQLEKRVFSLLNSQ